MMIVSFSTPIAFLHSKPCKESYDLVEELAFKHHNNYVIDIEEYEFTVSRSKVDNAIMVSVSSKIFGPSGQVQYRFAKDGKVTVIAFLYEYEYVYVVENAYPIFYVAYYNNKPTSISSTDKKLAEASIQLAERVFDYALSVNKQHYDFYDILKDYDKYKNSINPIRISSITLTSIFTVATICGGVCYVILSRKKQKADIPQEDKIIDNQ